MKQVFEEFEETQALMAKGFISAYLHAGQLEFVPMSDEAGHGYYRIPRGQCKLERHANNMIVSKASQFMAKRMRPGTSWGAGITHLEVGTGAGTGTPTNPQPEQLGQTALRVPLARKAITSWIYLKADGTPADAGVETNIVQYTTTFDYNEANGGLVEMGMFGGDATATMGSGYMFNYKTFSQIPKDNKVQLTLVWKITY